MLIVTLFIYFIIKIKIKYVLRFIERNNVNNENMNDKIEILLL